MAKRYVTDRTADGSEVRRARPIMRSTNEVIRELVADGKSRMVVKSGDMDTSMIDGWISDLEAVYNELGQYDWSSVEFIRDLISAIDGLKAERDNLTQSL